MKVFIRFSIKWSESAAAYPYAACHNGLSLLLVKDGSTPARALKSAPPVFQPGLENVYPMLQMAKV